MQTENSPENPYQAPQANLKELEIQEYCNPPFFSPENRLGIIRFILHLYASSFLFFIGLLILSADVFLLNFIIFSLFFYIFTCAIIKRLHDINLSGWWIFAYIIALIIFNRISFLADYRGFAAATFLLLFMIPATKSKNNYGFPNSPNTLIMYIFSIIAVIHFLFILESTFRFILTRD